ncbi:MAG: hypothetical protein KA248_11935 [Kiritimatiellae bacterium]|nr:hypothetical protein [Kiritimatiellia bacterium]
MRRLTRLGTIAAIILLMRPIPSAATEHAANGWLVKKWSRETSCRCGDVIRYYILVQRTGGNADNVVINDGRPAASTGYVPGSIVSMPSIPYSGGSTDTYVAWNHTMNQGDIFVAQYDVQLSTPLYTGQRIRNYVQVNKDPYDANYHISADYDLWAAMGNYTRGAKRNSGAAGEPVNAATGEYFLEPLTDLDLGGPLPLRFTRWYGSALNDPGFDTIGSALGMNWMHNFEVQAFKPASSWSMFVIAEGGKQVYFTEVYSNSSSSWSLNFEQEPVPYEFKYDGADFWFLDPERERAYRFDATTRSYAKEVVDRNGNALLIQRRSDMRVTNVTDGLGRSLRFEYNAASNLVGVTDGARAVSFGQDTNGYLVAFTNALGGATQYAYDPVFSHIGLNEALMTSIQYPRGNIPYTQTYDINGQVVAQADAYGNNSAFAYTPPTTGVTQVTDPSGTFAQTHYDRRQVAEFTDQASNTFRIGYHLRDVPTNLVDRQGFETAFAYEEDSRRLTEYVDAGGRTTLFTYAWTEQTFTSSETGSNVVFRFRDLTGVTHPDGTTEQFHRDGRGNVTNYVDRAGATWRITYNSRGQPLTLVNPRGGVQAWAYNADGTLASASNTDAGPVTFSYDALRRRTKSTYPDGASESLELDALDRVTRATNGYGQATAFAFDANSVPTGNTDPAGRILTHLTDLLDRRTNTADNLGPLRTATYDAMGRLATETDPAGTTTYGYDLRGWPTSVSRGGRTRQRRYDADGRVTNTVSPLGNTVTYRRDARGLPTQIVDPLSRTSSLAYDAMGRLVSAADPLGNKMSFGYDAAGRPVSMTNPVGASASIERDAAGQVIRQTDFDNNAWTFGRSPMGLLTAVTNPLAQVTRFTYDTSGRPAQRDHADGTHETWAYDAMDRVRMHTDRGTNAWSYGYDALGRLVAATNPAGGVTRYAYNLDGTADSASDSDTGPVSNRYDAARRRVQTLLPGGAAVSFAYNTNDEIVAVTDANGWTSRFDYDTDGRLTAATDPYSNQTRYVYDAAGRLTSVVNRVGGTTRFEYDAAGRLVAATDPAGVLTVYSNDAAGRRVSATVGGRTWRVAYNGSGFATSSVTPLGRSNRIVPDALQRPAALVDALGRSHTVTRDSLGRVTAVTDPLGLSATFAYESRGRLASAAGSGQAPALYEYDALGALTRLTDPNSNAWTFGYSAMGAALFAADPLGRTNRFTRNARGQVTRVTFTDESWADLSYAPAGQVTGTVHSTGESYGFSYDRRGDWAGAHGIAVQRDAEGRVTNTVSTADGRAFSAAYDAAGRLVSAGYDNGAFQVNYTYDPASGLLTGVSDTLSGASVSFQYDADSRLTGLARGNGVHTTYEYDDADQVARIAHGSLIDLRYGYDLAGRVTGLVSTAPVAAFGGVATLVTGTTYDAAAQASSAGYRYDSRGRLTNAPGHTFAWNGASRLTGADGAGLAYNGLGGLVTRTEAGTSTRFYYNHGLGLAPIVAERNDTAGTFARYYVWTPRGVLLYMIDVAAGHKPRYGHFDRVGSTVALTDEAGAVTDAYAYTPFGQIAGRLGASSQPFTYIGAWGVRREGNGALYQMRERYYDAALGRFLSPEPLWPQIRRPKALNPYQYAGADPVRRMDPTGLDDEPIGVFVNSNTKSIQFIDPLSLSQLEQSFYWRVDEVSDAPSPPAGDVWSFGEHQSVWLPPQPPAGQFWTYQPPVNPFGAIDTPTPGPARSKKPLKGLAIIDLGDGGVVIGEPYPPYQDSLHPPFQPPEFPQPPAGQFWVYTPPVNPFGSLDTPASGPTRSSIPVTGWVLDDIGPGALPGPHYMPGPGNPFGQTYYWRVDEVGDAPQPPAGSVWSFSPRGYLDPYCHQRPRNTSPQGSHGPYRGGRPPNTGIGIPPKRGTSQLFGVDTIALDPVGNYLYVANPTASGGLSTLSIIDLTAQNQVNYMPGSGIPTGIAFSTIKD